MHPSFLVVALSALLASLPGSEGPTWLRDYSAARQQGREEQKPLCVIIGSGQNGWQQLSEEGRFGPKVRRLLADNYVCLYVDTEHIGGRELAAQFDMSGPGIVISSGKGDLQAFRHQGTLPADRLVTYLDRYADPSQPVMYTETNPDMRVSYYAPPAAPVTPAYVPVVPMGFSGGFGGGCPT